MTISGLSSNKGNLFYKALRKQELDRQNFLKSMTKEELRKYYSSLAEDGWYSYCHEQDDYVKLCANILGYKKLPNKDYQLNSPNDLTAEDFRDYSTMEY